jgi:hypothetical protein
MMSMSMEYGPGAAVTPQAAEETLTALPVSFLELAPGGSDYPVTLSPGLAALSRRL